MSMMSNLHTPQIVGTLAIGRRNERRKSSRQLLQASTTAEETCLIVDAMIQHIQQQLKDELGFKEIVIATRAEADETTTLTGLGATNMDLQTASGGSAPRRRHSIAHFAAAMTSSGSSKLEKANGASTPKLPLSTTSSSGEDDGTRGFLRSDAASLENSGRGANGVSTSPPASSSDMRESEATCENCARGTVYVSPKYASKKRLLVIVPYREAGIWSRSICMNQKNANDTSGSMFAYLKKALAENYGVLIMNPAGQVCHPKNHVERAWDQLVVPLKSQIYVIAFSRGTQFVKHLLTHDNGNGVMQERLKALALVEPSHYVSDSDCYFARRILARRAVAWILSADVDVGCKIPKGEARHGCICISAGAVPSNSSTSSGAWALEMVMTCVFATFAARTGEAAGVTVNDHHIHSCGLCHRKLGVLNRRMQCGWCEVKYCSKCCEDRFVAAFGDFRICLLCQKLPCLIDPRRKNRIAQFRAAGDTSVIDRNSVFIQPREEELISLADFEIIKLIGRGACGRVKLVRKTHGSDEGAFYAMKAIKKKQVIQRGLVEATNAERRILHRIKHPYIATLCYAFQNNAKLYLLSKYYPGGNLLDQMRLARRFPEDRTRLYAAEVALAIDHLHRNDIIYRDLKLENVLVGSDGHVALTDFGMSKENMSMYGRTSTFVGTYQMMAPEIFSGKSYSRMVDWWALGVMVYEMIDGRTPFNAKTNRLIKERIVNVDLHFSARFTREARDFVSRLLTKDETERLGAGSQGFSNIKRHPWFRGLDWARVELQEATFRGQQELMQSHAKEYQTSDIFETYMNTLEVPIDTPASVRSTQENLFDDFEFNHLNPEAPEPEFESPTERGWNKGNGVGSVILYLPENENGTTTTPMSALLTPVKTTPASPVSPPDAPSSQASRKDSQFDIGLLRPQQATDFECSNLSSLSSENASRSSESETQQLEAVPLDVDEIGDHLVSSQSESSLVNDEDELSDDEDADHVHRAETSTSKLATISGEVEANVEVEC